MSARCSRWFVIAALVHAVACDRAGPELDVYFSPTDEPLQAAKIPTFEDFKRSHALTGGEPDRYVVDWDIPLTSEAELREYYDWLYVAKVPKGIVNRVNIGGTWSDDLWTTPTQVSLRYCVANEFGSLQARAIQEMDVAAQDWLRVANVRFIYRPLDNGNCNGSNTNVTFAVMPWDRSGACSFFPNTGSCVARSLVINIPDFDTNYGDTPNLRTVGVFRHELGHILGLRHEHTRPESGTCFENNNWRALTPYDRDSVMHYPWCNGNSSSAWNLTGSDGLSARSLYGMPPAWGGSVTLL